MPDRLVGHGRRPADRSGALIGAVARATPRRRLLVVLVLGLVPWTVFVVVDRATLVFPFGFVDLNPALDPAVRLVWLPDLLRFGGGLPRQPELLPVSGLLYLAALGSAATGLLDRENPRLTAGLLVLAAVAGLGVAAAVLHRLRYTPLPVGTLGLLAAAWWFYWPDLRGVVQPAGDDDPAGRDRD